LKARAPRAWALTASVRDHRPERPQVLLAVATDSEGVPLHVEVLRGNRADTTTLHGLLQALKRRFGLREAVFVFDGGMSSRLNLEALQKEHLPFVTRLSPASLPEVLAALPQDPQPELWDRTQLLEVSLEGKRYVIAGGQERQQRDRARREARLAKAEAALARLAAVKRKKVDGQKLASQAGRALQRLKAHKYFDYRVDKRGRLHWQKKRSAHRSRAEPRRLLPVAHQPGAGPRRQSPGAGPLQKPAGGRSRLRPTQELFGGAARLPFPA
jgi:transposase